MFGLSFRKKSGGSSSDSEEETKEEEDKLKHDEVFISLNRRYINLRKVEHLVT